MSGLFIWKCRYSEPVELGEEGVDYEVVDAENNIINYPDGKDDSNTYHLAEGWQLFDQFKMHIWEGDSPDIWDETKALNESAIKSKAFGFTYDSTSVANELAALSNVKAKSCSCSWFWYSRS